MKEIYSVDRIEGEIAKVENPDGSFTDIPLSALPSPLREGDILLFEEESGFIVDKTATTERKKKLLELQNNLFNN